MRLFPALIMLCILAVVSACTEIQTAEPPQVHLTDIQMLDGGILEQRFQVDLRVGNPNNFDLPLDGLTFDLELNDRSFAQGFSNEAVTIPRLGEAMVRVIATTTLFDVVQQVLVLGQRDDLSYRIEGQVYLQGITSRAVPYEQSGRMRLVPDRSNTRTLVPL